MEHLQQDAYCSKGQYKTRALNREVCLDWGFSCGKINVPIQNEDK